MRETIRLFKAVLVDEPNRPSKHDAFEVHRKTLPKGFVFEPSVLTAYPNIDAVIEWVDAECGLDPNRLNKAFHKSFGKVQSAPMEQLFAEQIAHYLTTYGAEHFGIYDADSVYIPTEALDVPPIDVATFDFVVIRGWSLDQFKVALLDLLASGAALSEQSVKDCLSVAAAVNLTLDEIEQVRNREVKIGLYELYGKVPSDPVEFLRYVVYKLTGSTLLIKNPATVTAVKAGVAEHNLVPLFNLYNSITSIDRLGEIFFRFKPLFLAMRADKALRPTINRIRRVAERNHKPMPQDYLNGVTAQVKGAGRQRISMGKGAYLTVANQFDFDRLADELNDPRINTFRKIRLANALAVRADRSLDSIVYKVRNGKSYATDFETLSDEAALLATRAYQVVIDSVSRSLRSTVYGKNVYIPDGVLYGLPATEKQFIGNLPAGTSVHLDAGQPLVAGVYWEDQGRDRIDLDLSVENLGEKIGWDGSYRSGGGTVLFSGDVTSAPNGASEVFWFDPGASGSWMMNINYFNYREDLPVPFKVVVGTADASDINKNFVVDPNRLLASAPAVLDVKQMNLGIIAADRIDGHRFFFSSSTAGGGISSRYRAHDERARKFMMASLTNAPTLNEVLASAGANFVNDPSLADDGLNLSPAAIDKTTFLSLLS